MMSFAIQKTETIAGETSTKVTNYYALVASPSCNLGSMTFVELELLRDTVNAAIEKEKGGAK